MYPLPANRQKVAAALPRLVNQEQTRFMVLVIGFGFGLRF